MRIHVFQTISKQYRTYVIFKNVDIGTINHVIFLIYRDPPWHGTYKHIRNSGICIWTGIDYMVDLCIIYYGRTIQKPYMYTNIYPAYMCEIKIRNRDIAEKFNAATIYK